MTQLSNWHFEECEKEGCTNGAVVGFSNGNIHVCSVCAALPEFSRMKPSVLPRRLTSRLLAVEGQGPVAWRYRHHNGVAPSNWRYVDIETECNMAPNYHRQPLYAAPQPVAVPLDYAQGEQDGREWAAQMAEANHPQTGDWLYDDPLELAKAIRKGPDLPIQQSSGALQLPEAIADNRLNSGPDADDYYVGYQSGWNECLEAIGVAPVNPEFTTQSQWIPCSERMPPEATMVLGRCDNDYDFVNLLGGHLKIFCMGEWRILPGAEITHWMPLPAAPQEPTK